MKLIDIHHQIIPEFYSKKISTVGVDSCAALKGIPFPNWNSKAMIETMDKNGIQVAITSITDPGVRFLDEKFTASLARECNEFSANLIEKFPGRIGAMGVLPLPYIEASLEEIHYCLDTLKLDGFILLSNYGKGYLGNQLYQPIFEELNKRGVTVFIHPTIPALYDPEYAFLPPAMFEFVFDTSRTLMSLLLSGRISTCSNIKFLIAHAGGVLPYLTSRLLYFSQFVKVRFPEKEDPYGFSNIPEGISNALKGLYYDTTLTMKPATINWVLEYAGSDHMAFGSDYPFPEESLVNEEVKDFHKFLSFDNEVTTNIAYKTAQILFPRFKDSSIL